MQKMTAQGHFVPDIVDCYHLVVSRPAMGHIWATYGGEEEMTADWSLMRSGDLTSTT